MLPNLSDSRRTEWTPTIAQAIHAFGTEATNPFADGLRGRIELARSRGVGHAAIHKNARLTPKGREEMVRAVVAVRENSCLGRRLNRQPRRAPPGAGPSAAVFKVDVSKGLRGDNTAVKQGKIESGSGLPTWIFPEKPCRRAELISAAIPGTNASSANVYSDNFISSTTHSCVFAAHSTILRSEARASIWFDDNLRPIRATRGLFRSIMSFTLLVERPVPRQTAFALRIM